MIGIDTNVLVRYIEQDDLEQAQQASAILDTLTSGHPGFIASVVLVELSWVLGKCYKRTRKQIAKAIKGLLSAKELMIENPDIAWKALKLYEESATDFSDCFIAKVSASAGCSYTLTFDKNAAKSCGMRLIVSDYPL